MISLEINAKTVEEALDEGIKKLGVKKENLKIDILYEPAQGLLKYFGSKTAKVRLTVKKEPEEFIKDFMLELLHIFSLEGDVNIEKKEEDDLYVKINGKDLGLLIGKRGNTLNSLQYLVNVVFHRQFANSKGRILLDVENYRQKRKQTLEQLAKNLALKALRTKKEVTLEPMTPQERRIIHLALKNNRDVITSSYGEEPYRKVVISPR
ncbi:MAG: protein jag [Dethiobacter sp.]|jgi:spoIIIJ-associated protein|nr:MAG: protein jag [Dethiobacter sp.]